MQAGPGVSSDYFRVVDGRLLFTNGVDVGAVYQEVDGYFVFSPNEHSGAWESFALREISDLLIELNQPWDDEVMAYFAGECDD